MAISPAVTLADRDGASPGLAVPLARGRALGREGAAPACLRYSGHCLHTMDGWLQGKHRARGDEMTPALVGV